MSAYSVPGIFCPERHFQKSAILEFLRMLECALLLCLFLIIKEESCPDYYYSLL